MPVRNGCECLASSEFGQIFFCALLERIEALSQKKSSSSSGGFLPATLDPFVNDCGWQGEEL